MKKKSLLLMTVICILSTTIIACGKADKGQAVDDNTTKVENKEAAASKENDDKNNEADKAKEDTKKEDTKKEEVKKEDTKTSNVKGKVADLEDYTKILDVEEGINYKKGDYAEVDFAIDVLKDFLAGKNIYDRIVSYNDYENMEKTPLIPINDEDKAYLDKGLKMAKLQMDVPEGKNIQVEPLSIEKDLKLKDEAECELNMKVKLIPEGGQDAYLNVYSINIFKVNGEFKAKIYY